MIRTKFKVVAVPSFKKKDSQEKNKKK